MILGILSVIKNKLKFNYISFKIIRTFFKIKIVLFKNNTLLSEINLN